jgi:hypothetical protein
VGELGLLSIDVDGMDWHLWEATTVVNPAIVVIEYNRNFPTDRAIVVPYDSEFDRHAIQPHYYGASLPALAERGKLFGRDSTDGPGRRIQGVLRSPKGSR